MHAHTSPQWESEAERGPCARGVVGWCSVRYRFSLSCSSTPADVMIAMKYEWKLYSFFNYLSLKPSKRKVVG